MQTSTGGPVGKVRPALHAGFLAGIKTCGVILLLSSCPTGWWGPSLQASAPYPPCPPKTLGQHGWNEPVFRGTPPPRLSHRKHAVPPQHLLTMGNSLSRAFRRRASSSSGSLRACEEIGRGAKAAWKKAQWHTQPTHLPASGSTNKPQPGASQPGGGRR